MLYPKINSLYKRDGHDFTQTGVKGSGKLMLGVYARGEFSIINHWYVQEKLDGTNIRIIFERHEHGEPTVSIGGRTENAMIPSPLLNHLRDTFTVDKLDKQFEKSNYVLLFGEGIGPKIQSGGYYTKEPKFVLFDVFCSGWWLDIMDVAEVANNLEIPFAPLCMPGGQTVGDIEAFVRSRPPSIYATAETHIMEGVVARPIFPLLFRNKEPVVFKLKCRDFE